MDTLKSKQVLVTGATGFIGSHLVQRLVAEGARVRALSHYRGHPGLHNLEYLSREERAAIEVIRGDVQDPFQMRSCVAGCDVVFHLAALIAIPYSYQAPASYVRTNVLGTLNVLEACRSERTPRLVHTSTSETYGSAIYTPIDEQHPLQGQSPYSATKIGADKLAESYYRSFDLGVVTVRPFNTFGPRQSARAVIPTIITQLLAGRSPLRLGSLTPVRDLNFVTDTVDGFVRAACANNVAGETINVGHGAGITIGDLAKRIIKLLGKEVPIESDEQRVRPEKSEVMALICANAKAKQLLGWTPRVHLDEGLQRVIEFVKDNMAQFKLDEYGV
jgi:NAD dependent epimerase/dehydratase